mgnify:CR=1 FL=1
MNEHSFIDLGVVGPPYHHTMTPACLYKCHTVFDMTIIVIYHFKGLPRFVTLTDNFGWSYLCTIPQVVLYFYHTTTCCMICHGIIHATMMVVPQYKREPVVGDGECKASLPNDTDNEPGTEWFSILSYEGYVSEGHKVS